VTQVLGERVGRRGELSHREWFHRPRRPGARRRAWWTRENRTILLPRHGGRHH
jgi:hypothetical protein